MIPEIRDERQQRALTGVPTEKISTFWCTPFATVNLIWKILSSHKVLAFGTSSCFNTIQEQL